MIIHLIDGTYELFRHFYGIRRFKKTDPPYGAVTGVLRTVAQCSTTERLTSESQLITSSSRSATVFGHNTRPAPASIRSYDRSSFHSRRLLSRWVWPCGP